MTKTHRKCLSLLGMISAAVLALWPATAPAQNVFPVECPNPDNNLAGMYADVIVIGGTCTLNGATVFGSVLVDGGGVITTASGASIFGSILVKAGDDVTLTNANVSGGITTEDSESVSVTNSSVADISMIRASGNLTVGGGSTVGNISIKEGAGPAPPNVTIETSASAGEILVETAGDVTVENASVAAIFATGSGGIDLTGARVFPGGVAMSLASGDLEICDSEIGINSATMTDGSGGVNMSQSRALLADASVLGCDPIAIEGSVVVEKGEGDVTLVGVDLSSGDVNVLEQEGSVTLTGAVVSDVKVQKTTVGNISLTGVTADSDTSIADNSGNVTIETSSLGSDVEIKSNGGYVDLMGNSFSLEDVNISNNGNVYIDANCDMRLTVTENLMVEIANNNPTDATAAGATCESGFGFTDADVSKNGVVDITNNTGEGLFCSDNSSVGGAGNTITFTDGQCAGL